MKSMAQQGRGIVEDQRLSAKCVPIRFDGIMNTRATDSGELY